MTTTQMKHFITVATCLNYTEAANQLYISQPALSRQIISLERELDLQLFIRDKRSMRLTPAGESLLEELKAIYTRYLAAIERAQQLQRGMFGELNIGVLDGHLVSDTFPDIVSTLEKQHPNVSINLFRGSFRQLVDALYTGTADFIITLEFSVQDKQKFDSKTLAVTRDSIVMLKSNPLAGKDLLTLEDLRDQTLIAIAQEDSRAAYEGMELLHRMAGCSQPLRVAPNLETLTLWIQAGLGISILNEFNSLAKNDDLVYKDWEGMTDPLAGSTDLVLAWRKDSSNPVVPVFLENL